MEDISFGARIGRWCGSFSWLHGDGMWLNGIFGVEQIW